MPASGATRSSTRRLRPSRWSRLENSRNPSSRPRGRSPIPASYPVAPSPAAAAADEGRDKFQHFETNPVKRTADDPVSTFSVDVDTAAYSFVRRKLTEGVHAADGRRARRGDDQLLRLRLAHVRLARSALQAHDHRERFALGQGKEADPHRHQGLRAACRASSPTSTSSCCST